MRLASDHVQTFVSQDTETGNQINDGVRGPLSEWDKPLLAGGYFEDPESPFIRTAK
jgi:hypothetical protein